MDGQVYYEDKTYCPNITNEFERNQLFPVLWKSSMAGILLLVPTLILQLFFIYRYKSTFLHRQFIYATIVVILLDIIYILYPITVDVGCPFFYQSVESLNRYMLYVEMMQITTIHLLLLYKLCKHMETRTIQRLQTLCCNIRPRLWHEVMIVCIQLGLPLPIVIAEVVVILKTNLIYSDLEELERKCLIMPLLSFNILLGLICTVLLVVWFGMLWKRRLLRNKVKFVCTQMGHTFFVLVVILTWNTIYLFLEFEYIVVVTSIVRTFSPVSFGVYIFMSIPHLQRKVPTTATNRHTNPPSTRVSLPIQIQPNMLQTF